MTHKQAPSTAEVHICVANHVRLDGRVFRVIPEQGGASCVIIELPPLTFNRWGGFRFPYTTAHPGSFHPDAHGPRGQVIAIAMQESECDLAGGHLVQVTAYVTEITKHGARIEVIDVTRIPRIVNPKNVVLLQGTITAPDQQDRVLRSLRGTTSSPILTVDCKREDEPTARRLYVPQYGLDGTTRAERFEVDERVEILGSLDVTRQGPWHKRRSYRLKILPDRVTRLRPSAG
jgi:hypothetical protein